MSRLKTVARIDKAILIQLVGKCDLMSDFADAFELFMSDEVPARFNTPEKPARRNWITRVKLGRQFLPPPQTPRASTANSMNRQVKFKAK